MVAFLSINYKNFFLSGAHADMINFVLPDRTESNLVERVHTPTSNEENEIKTIP